MVLENLYFFYMQYPEVNDLEFSLPCMISGCQIFFFNDGLVCYDH